MDLKTSNKQKELCNITASENNKCKCKDNSGYITVDGVDLDNYLPASIQQNLCKKCRKVIGKIKIMENIY